MYPTNKTVPTPSSPPSLRLYTAPSVALNNSPQGTSSVPTNTPSRSLHFVISTKSKDVNDKSTTSYTLMVPIFSTNTSIWFTDYIIRTDPTEVPSPKLRSPPKSDPENRTYLPSGSTSSSPPKKPSVPPNIYSKCHIGPIPNILANNCPNYRSFFCPKYSSTHGPTIFIQWSTHQNYNTCEISKYKKLGYGISLRVYIVIFSLLI